MISNPFVSAIRAFGMLALVAATPVDAVRSGDADAVNLPRQSSATPAVSAPIILAQGRCYNGRCY